MKNIIILIFLILAFKTVKTTNTCDANSVWKDTQCISNELCCSGGGFLSINGLERTCISSCPFPNYFEFSGYLVTCAICPDATPIPDSERSSCGLCNQSQIADVLSHTCLSSPSECTQKISKDLQICSPTCKDSKFEYNHLALIYCQDTCPDSAYIGLDGTTCQDSCPLTDNRTSQSKCLKAYSECTSGVVNAGGDECLAECPIGTVSTDQITYRQCAKCASQTFYQKLAGGAPQCVSQCDVSLIQDVDKGICIDRSECTKFLSSNLKQCSNGCLANEFIINDGQSYQKCSVSCSDYSYLIGNSNTCIKSCPSGVIIDEANKKCIDSKSGCNFALSFDGKKCVTQCDASKKETAVDKQCTPCSDYFSTSDNTCVPQCIANTITDSSNKMCYNQKKECKQIISSDNLKCGSTCDSNGRETSISQNNGEFYQCVACQKYYVKPNLSFLGGQCLDDCPSDMIKDSAPLSCLSNPSDCTKYISADKKSCIASCNSPKKEYPTTQTDSNGTFKQCQVCDKYFKEIAGQENKCQTQCDNGDIVDEANKICYSAPSLCPLVISADGTKCVATCDDSKREFAQPQTDYKKCTVCNNYFSPTFGSVSSTCTASCSQWTTQDDINKVCVTPISECLYYISSNGKNCVLTCDDSNKEYVKVLSCTKKCEVCTDYYTGNTNVKKRTCTTSCDSNNYLQVIPTRTCVQKSSGCPNGLFLSSDQTFCDKQCNYPDIQKDQACISEKSCSGVNLIIDETASPTKCASTTGNYSCSLKSSDGKRCVNTCISIQEAEPAQGMSQCQACVSPKKFYVIDNDGVKTGGCKETITADDKLLLIEQQLSNPLNTGKEIEALKKSIGDFIVTLESSNPASSNNSNNSQNICSLEHFTMQLLSKLQSSDSLLGIKDTPLSVGDNGNVKMIFQAAKKGKKFKKIVNLKDIMSDSPTDLTEDDLDGSSSAQGIVYSVLNKTPGCNSASCQDYPGVKLKIIKNFSRLLRVGSTDSTYYMDFPVTHGKQNYVCLAYDLSTNQVLTINPAVVSTDGTTARCPVSLTELTSLYLDTECKYLNPSNCSSSSDSNGGSLSAGEIVGIVFGSIGFALLIGICCFFILYRDMIKRKKSKAKYEEPKGLNTTR